MMILINYAMAINIEFISHLPLELQEDILEMISKRVDKDCPLEIDDEVYFVERPVADLVDQLTEECVRYKNEVRDLSGIQKD
tara:strand:- start:286 stop:531 length:246 start_codon:yes stop_codon:yes gene_type:complete